MCREQNFVIEFFHLHSQTNVPYEEFINSGAPEARTMRDLGMRRMVDQDRIMGRMVVEYIGEVFSFLVTDLGNFVDWATKFDPLYELSPSPLLSPRSIPTFSMLLTLLSVL